MKESPQSADSPAPSFQKPGRSLGVVGLLLGLSAILGALFAGKLAFLVLGLSILLFGLFQNYTGFALSEGAESGSWFTRGGGSIVTGLLLLGLPHLTFTGLAILLGLSWGASGVSTVIAALRRPAQEGLLWSVIDGLITVGLGLAVAVQWPVSGIVSIGLLVGLRYLSAGWSALVGQARPGPVPAAEAANLHPDERLALPPHPYLGRLREELAAEELIRARSDRAWSWLFVLTFFAIHAARMDAEWNLLGLLSPAGAVAGDVLVAVLLAYGVVAPISVVWCNLTRRVERSGWNWYLARLDRSDGTGFMALIVRKWLVHRMRSAVRQDQARGSVTAAVGWGLRTGLPAAALLVALTPLWGVNWFFDTESWVTGAWEMWADQRTDTWRTEMVRAVRTDSNVAPDDPEFFRIRPEGVTDSGDFSFIVIGDTGEGDASQHVLRDQLLRVGQKPEVKFLVLSSDVIYPSGAMKDYEQKFYLPFKGLHKPIYALPGNHDWYDALEAFTANFFEPRAAGAALRGRRQADHNLTTTTESRIDGMIAEAERLRGQYQIKTARQRAPYFELHTDGFSLVVVDTGILRRLDDDQQRWLDAALGRGRGRFKMAILGHPLYVANRYQATQDTEFARVHELLKKDSVNVVMAGDTHDFEYYKVDDANGKGRPVYHFVNGGGGAYLSIGTALDWPAQPVVPQCGCYPRPDALTDYLETSTPTWRRPLWLWCKHLGAWPSSRETVGSAFDYNYAPFFQSFMEVKVEVSTNTVRYWLHGVNGRLRWRDLHVQGGPVSSGHTADDFVEFTLPLSPGTP